ncbi:MAG: cob(I)yrinic acid a,c-diamide adenosyltransferase [Deltaproteobacteria bacterium]|nr:cob(I)yrinic acid a,c-diamide adenosyltransferase [Deltaproteobacteria bacterium]MBW2069786.1 cob(I)yrinic acid a,c-diamide adenosyltransferase [Deltaproteobacteria bacterium]
MKIYSGRGDGGQSRLLSGERVEKDDPRLKTFGALDELQSHLGMARAMTRQEFLRRILYAVQQDTFVASSEIASTGAALSKLDRRLQEVDIAKVENWIDELTASYGLPRGFVVPGRSQDSAAVHVARAVCRRCERLILVLNRQESGLYGRLLVYYNRLSDLLFVLAWVLELRAIVEEAVRSVLEVKSAEGH